MAWFEDMVAAAAKACNPKVKEDALRLKIPAIDGDVAKLLFLFFVASNLGVDVLPDKTIKTSAEIKQIFEWGERFGKSDQSRNNPLAGFMNNDILINSLFQSCNIPVKAKEDFAKAIFIIMANQSQLVDLNDEIAKVEEKRKALFNPMLQLVEDKNLHQFSQLTKKLMDLTNKRDFISRLEFILTGLNIAPDQLNLISMRANSEVRAVAARTPPVDDMPPPLVANNAASAAGSPHKSTITMGLFRTARSGSTPWTSSRSASSEQRTARSSSMDATIGHRRGSQITADTTLTDPLKSKLEFLLRIIKLDMKTFESCFESLGKLVNSCDKSKVENGSIKNDYVAEIRQQLDTIQKLNQSQQSSGTRIAQQVEAAVKEIHDSLPSPESSPSSSPHP